MPNGERDAYISLGKLNRRDLLGKMRAGEDESMMDWVGKEMEG